MITEDKELNKRWQVVFGISLTEKVLHNIFEHYYAPFKVTETCLELGTSQFTLKTRLEQLIGMISSATENRMPKPRCFDPCNFME